MWLDKAVAAGDLIPDQLRVTHLDRGLAYMGKEDGQKALEAFTAAIGAGPGDLTAYHHRISIYLLNGQLENALADFNALNRLRQGDFATLMNIGRLNWYLGHTEASAAAFESFDPSSHMAWIWLQLANVRLGKKAGEFPDNSAAAFWPAPVARFYAGHISEAELLKIAADEKATTAVCEGNVFAGLWRGVQGDQTGARPLLEAAMKTCDKDTNDWYAAHNELDRMKPEGKTP
ncbi:MAG: hypothetical protein H0U98_03950 [Alphaproteobacteria bacterium]|nr:hypothetical protein [Alphaproteobacteria bacterium]